MSVWRNIEQLKADEALRTEAEATRTARISDLRVHLGNLATILGKEGFDTRLLFSACDNNVYPLRGWRLNHQAYTFTDNGVRSSYSAPMIYGSLISRRQELIRYRGGGTSETTDGVTTIRMNHVDGSFTGTPLESFSINQVNEVEACLARVVLANDLDPNLFKPPVV